MRPDLVYIVPGKANPNRLNGVNKVVYSMASQIQQAGHAIEVWGIAADTKLEADYPFSIRLFQGDMRKPVFPAYLRKSIKQKSKETLFHLHGVMHPLYLLLAIYFRRKGYNYVVTAHGALLRRSLRRGFWYKYPYIYLFERYVMHHAKCIHAITDQEKKELKKLFPKAKIKIIPNGVPLQDRDKPVKLKHEEPVFLYMGRFDKEHKGLDIALDAFAMFHQKSRKGEFLLAGQGKDQSWLNDKIKQLHLNHKIRLLPPQFGADKDKLMATADIFVHPSRWDVLPTVTLEAAAIGKPLIVSKATGYGSSIHHCRAGWTTYTNHASELSQKFLLAYRRWSKGELHDTGVNAQKMIKDYYTWPAIMQDYYKVLYSHD